MVRRAVAVGARQRDIEAGFGRPEEAALLAVPEAGAVGGTSRTDRGERRLVPIPLHCEKIRSAKEAAAAGGGDLVVNARIDVFFRQIGDPGSRFEEAVHRSNAFRAAGADCVFMPGVTDEETIGRLVAAIDGPVNILAGPESPPVAALSRMRVARVSLGSGPARASLGHLRRVARELAESGTYSAIASDAISYAEANDLFSPR